MKKHLIALGLALALCLSALGGCSFGTKESGASAGTGSAAESAPWQGGVHDESSRGEEPPREEEPPRQEEPEQAPALSPLAVLDTVDISAAFGTRDGKEFTLKAEGDLNASYGSRLTSEIDGKDKLNLECGLGVGLEDLFGLRLDESGAFGAGLFGGGKASLSLEYRGPSADADPLRKNFDVGFRHDGDLIWYAGEGEDETEISLSELKEKLEEAAATETFRRMETAFMTIPEELKKGASLRLAVEKLIDLGFTAEIDDSDGVAVSLKANAGFYTDLLNDMLENFLPEEWLSYLPRADLGYEKTVFDILLSFDGKGMFREYSMSSDVALSASLEVRGLFSAGSVLKAGGALSFTADGVSA